MGRDGVTRRAPARWARLVIPALVVGAWVGLWAAPVRAAIVMIVRPAVPSPVTSEALSRLRGELLSVGLTVEVVTRPSLRPPDGASSRAWLEQLAAERHVDGALDIVDGAAPAAVDVWTFSREPHRAEVTHVVAEPGVASALERMAIRSVEVLRSSLIEAGLVEAAGDTAGPSAPVPVVRGEEAAGKDQAPSPPPGASFQLGLEVGAAVIVPSFDDVAPAVAPLVRVNGATTGPVALQIEAAGFGSRPQVGNSSGSARIAEQYALAGLCTCGPSPRRLRPTVALLTGVLHTSVDGRGEAPAQGHAVTQWSLLVQASLGARMVAFSRYELAVAVHAQVAEPYVAVYVGDEALATLGRPTLGVTLTVGGWR
ncbi:MAG TPA: hypothetical protein VIU64_19660 [Polyangia bacterium]